MQYKDICDNLNIKDNFYSVLSSAGIAENKFIQPENGKYPANNVAVFMSGCPASCKSTIIDYQLLIDGKIISVDSIIELYKRMLNRKYKNLATKEEKDMLSSVFDNRLPIDFSTNPTRDDVDYWYYVVSSCKGDFLYDSNGDVIIDEKTGEPRHEGLPREVERVFFNANKGNVRLPNVIFDITGSDVQKLKQSIYLVKDMGYYVLLVCAVINVDEAIRRNAQRAERVEDSTYLKDVHETVYSRLPQQLKSGNLKELDEAWIIFTGDFSQEFDYKPGYNGERQKVITNDDWSVDTAFRLIKHSNGTFTLPDDEIKKRFLETIGHQF